MIDIIGTVTTEGVAERFRDAGDAIRERIRRTLSQLSAEGVSRAQAGAPVKSGDMRGGIQALYVETMTEQRAIIKAPHPALWLEHGVVAHGGGHNRNLGKGKKGKLRNLHELRAAGTWRIKPRPFMGPALTSMRSQIEADLSAAIAAGAESGAGG